MEAIGFIVVLLGLAGLVFHTTSVQVKEREIVVLADSFGERVRDTMEDAGWHWFRIIPPWDAVYDVIPKKWKMLNLKGWIFQCQVDDQSTTARSDDGLADLKSGTISLNYMIEFSDNETVRREQLQQYYSLVDERRSEERSGLEEDLTDQLQNMLRQLFKGMGFYEARNLDTAVVRRIQGELEAYCQRESLPVVLELKVNEPFEAVNEKIRGAVVDRAVAAFTRETKISEASAAKAAAEEDRQKKILDAKAEKEAKKILAEGDAEALKTLADKFGMSRLAETDQVQILTKILELRTMEKLATEGTHTVILGTDLVAQTAQRMLGALKGPGNQAPSPGGGGGKHRRP